MKKQILALAALLVVGLSSCNKDDDKSTTEDRPKTKIEILTASAWNIQSVKVTEEIGDSITNEYQMPMLGTITFKTDKTVIIQIPGEDAEESAWAINDEALWIDEELYTLVELTDTKLEIMQEVEETDPEIGKVFYRTEIKLNR